jgi:hypothetical protein
MKIYSKINIFVRKFLLERLDKNKKFVDRLLEDWDSKENQTFLKSRFTEKMPSQKSFTRQDWNSFKKENYKKIKKELGENSKPKDVMAELSKRWKKEKEKQSKQIIPYRPLPPLPGLFTSIDSILGPDDLTVHKIISEMLKDIKETDKTPPTELPISPTSKKNLEREEREEKETKAYNAFCEFHYKEIEKENPEFNSVKITKILAKKWRDLSPKEKSDWNIVL